MSVNTTRHLNKTKRRKIWLTCRTVTALIGLFVLVNQTTFADSIPISEVVQTINPTQGLVELRVKNLAQEPVSGNVKGTVASRTEKTRSSDDVTPATLPLMNVEVSSQQQQLGVEVVGDAIVEGTVCDCGE